MSPRKSNIAAPSRGITQVEAAERLRISSSWARTLTSRGVLTRDGDGTYPWPQVAEEFDAYQEGIDADEHPSADKAGLEAARTRKYLVEALIREDELAARRGELIPADEVLDRVRRPLEAVDAKLRTVARRYSKGWAAKLGVSQAEVMALMHEIIEDVRAELRQVFENDDGDARAA